MEQQAKDLDRQVDKAILNATEKALHISPVSMKS